MNDIAFNKTVGGTIDEELKTFTRGISSMNHGFD